MFGDLVLRFGKVNLEDLGKKLELLDKSLSPFPRFAVITPKI